MKLVEHKLPDKPAPPIYRQLPETGFLRLNQIVTVPGKSEPPIIPISRTSFLNGVIVSAFFIGEAENTPSDDVIFWTLHGVMQTIKDIDATVKAYHEATKERADSDEAGTADIKKPT
jgi:hypothetical protein